jgi:hypothetical protein
VPRLKNEWSYTSTPQYTFMALCLKHRDNLTFTHRVQVYADDVSIFDENMNTAKVIIEALLVASKEAGLEANTGKTMSVHQNVGQSHNFI